MVTNGRVEWHRYQPDRPGLASLARAIALLGYIGVPVLLCGLTVSPAFPLRTVGLLALPILLAGAVPFIASLVTTADISTDDEAVTLHISGPWQTTIPWEALRYSTVWEVEPPGHAPLLTLRRWEKVRAVYVPGLRSLTPVGMYYGLGQTPVFIITPDHERGDWLVRRIEHLQHPLKRRQPVRARPWAAPPRDEPPGEHHE